MSVEREQIEDRIAARVRAWRERVDETRAAGLYFFNAPIEELRGGARVRLNGRELLMFASYSYLGLIGHPQINAAAQAAIDKYGTGTHGVRMLAGSLDLHVALETAIAEYRDAEAAVTFSSGYVTNLTAISTLLSRRDYVISDKINHASIVDGCLLSGAKLLRFRHNDMHDLERCLAKVPPGAAKLVVVDAVFSMDGDIIDLPRVVELCRHHGAWLMVDEAHSVGVLGATGRGIEEHFGLRDVIDVKMGTLSKTIPSVGGFIAGRRDLVNMIRHASRAYIFSAALPPAQAAAAKAAIDIVRAEPWRVEAVQRNGLRFRQGLQQLGFNILRTETPIVPVMCGLDERAYEMVRACQQEDIFALPVVSPAVPEGQARLRATVTAAHTADEIDHALDVMRRAGLRLGMITPTDGAG